MKSVLIATLIFLFSLNLFSQDYCQGNPTESYLPLKLNTVKKYYFDGFYYTEKIIDNVSINNKMYFKVIQEYSKGSKTELYLRKDASGIFEYHKETNKEFLKLPSKLELNFTWYNIDSTVKFKIIDTIGIYKSPYCSYSNLLTIETKVQNKNNLVYTYYYKRGIGFIGGLKNGTPISFVDLKKKSACFPGGDDEMQKFIINNIEYPQKAKEEGIEGKVIIGFEVDTNGKLLNIKVLRSINSDLDSEAIRIVKLMPNWEPNYLINGETIKMSYQLPINFTISKLKE